MQDEVVIVKVKILSPMMRQRNGETMHLELTKARAAERRGLVKIMAGETGASYATREMLPGGGRDYLTKDRFTLSKDDMFGKKDMP
jgi:hypothetical protein